MSLIPRELVKIIAKERKSAISKSAQKWNYASTQQRFLTISLIYMDNYPNKITGRQLYDINSNPEILLVALFAGGKKFACMTQDKNLQKMSTDASKRTCPQSLICPHIQFIKIFYIQTLITASQTSKNHTIQATHRIVS